MTPAYIVSGRFAVHQQRGDLTLREACAGGLETGRAVFAGQNSAAIRGEEDVLRVARIDVDIVDDDVGVGRARPAVAAVGGLVETLGGSGIDRVAVRRVHRSERVRRAVEGMPWTLRNS